MAELKNNGGSFIELTEGTTGHVSVNLQKNNLVESESQMYHGKVERRIYSEKNILEEVCRRLPAVNPGTAVSVLNACGDVICDALGMGYAARFGKLGTFYVASKGLVSGQDENPELTAKFSPSEYLRNSVKDVKIDHASFESPKATISAITDVATGKTGFALTADGSVLVEGSGLRIGGEDSGIWFAPLSDGQKLAVDETTWRAVDSALVYNMPAKLLFQMPAGLVHNAQYKIVMRTRFAGKSRYERKTLIETVSDAVMIA